MTRRTSKIQIGGNKDNKDINKGAMLKHGGMPKDTIVHIIGGRTEVMHGGEQKENSKATNELMIMNNTQLVIAIKKKQWFLPKPRMLQPKPGPKQKRTNNSIRRKRS